MSHSMGEVSCSGPFFTCRTASRQGRRGIQGRGHARRQTAKGRGGQLGEACRQQADGGNIIPTLRHPACGARRSRQMVPSRQQRTAAQVKARAVDLPARQLGAVRHGRPTCLTNCTQAK